jgi:hypothetical protein
MEEHEEYEQIPWSELTNRPPDGRRRSIYLIAGGLGALILVVLVARAFLSPSPADPLAPAVTLAQSETTTTAAAATATTTAPASPAPSLLYREEDLMAFPATPGERAAVARAEWFVTDYFTADLEPSGSADVRTALPAGAEVPDMPQDAAASLSYVEWARAFRVEELGDGLFRVGVVFRTLGAPPDRGFYRLPVRAVEVLVQVNEDGGSVVADLPAPVALPAGPEPAGWPEESQEPPHRVADAALRLVAGWGQDPRLVSAQRSEQGWRVVLTLADEVGNRWPAAVFVEAANDEAGG